MSVQERKLLAKIFRNFSTRTVERKSLGLKTAQEIMLHLDVEFLQHTLKVSRGEMEPQDSPLLKSYQADWIPYRFSSSITGDLMLLALKAKSLSSPINLSEAKEIINTSMNTLRKTFKRALILIFLKRRFLGGSFWCKPLSTLLMLFLPILKQDF